MTLTAYDKKGESSIANVTVKVLDINDHAPKFENCDKQTTVSISESTDIDFPIFQVKARDEDIGENGRITFHYSSTVTARAKNIFSLSETDGWIRKRLNIFLFLDT